MLSNHSRGTLMSYADRSAQRRCISNKPHFRLSIRSCVRKYRVRSLNLFLTTANFDDTTADIMPTDHRLGSCEKTGDLQQMSMAIQNNFLGSNYSGFKSGHSTETALLSVIEALQLARAAFKSSIPILGDLSAAFDTAVHKIVLSTPVTKGI